jgi:hypothetical protein
MLYLTCCFFVPRMRFISPSLYLSGSQCLSLPSHSLFLSLPLSPSLLSLPLAPSCSLSLVFGTPESHRVSERQRAFDASCNPWAARRSDVGAACHPLSDSQAACSGVHRGWDWWEGLYVKGVHVVCVGAVVTLGASDVEETYGGCVQCMVRGAKLDYVAEGVNESDVILHVNKFTSIQHASAHTPPKRQTLTHALVCPL